MTTANSLHESHVYSYLHECKYMAGIWEAHRSRSSGSAVQSYYDNPCWCLKKNSFQTSKPLCSVPPDETESPSLQGWLWTSCVASGMAVVRDPKSVHKMSELNNIIRSRQSYAPKDSLTLSSNLAQLTLEYIASYNKETTEPAHRTITIQYIWRSLAFKRTFQCWKCEHVQALKLCTH